MLSIKKLSLLGLILTFFVALIAFKANNQPKTQLSETEAFIANYEQELQAEENRILGEFEKFGISRSEFDQRKESLTKELAGYFQQKQPTVSSATVSLIQEVCKDMAFNTIFNINLYNNPETNAASTNDTILINEKDFIILPINAQKWIIAHEITHMIYGDSIANLALDELITEKKIPQSNPLQRTLSNYHLFQENRADFYGACVGSEYAKGFEDFMHFELKHAMELPNATHPKPTKRLEIAQLINQNAIKQQLA